MAFIEVQLPSTWKYRSSGGPSWNTEVTILNSGMEQRNQVWADARRQFTLHSLEVEEEIDALVQFFNAMRGRLHGFRIKDWQDCITGSNYTAPGASDEVLVGDVDGVNRDFQLTKHYTADTAVYSRPITKPISGTVVVSIDDVPTSAFSVDTTTGVVTMDVAPTTGEVIKGGCQFDIPVRFDTDTLDGRHDSFNIQSFSIPIVELKQEIA